MSPLLFDSLAEAARQRESVCLGVITGVTGSSPQKIGAKALFYPDGRIQGTLGGGCLEAEIQQRAIRSLQTNEPSTFDLLLDHDFGWDDGLICGGKVFGVILPNAQKIGAGFWAEIADRKSTMRWGVTEDFDIAMDQGGASNPLPADGAHGVTSPAGDWLYQETVSPPCALWIAGAGHVAQAVAPLALGLDFSVTVFDDRPALANHQLFPPETLLRVGEWKKLCAEPLPPVPAFGLIVTRGHRHDAQVLKEWIQKKFRFLGMIGSARKARIISEHFLEEKIATAEQLRRVACPVGIKIKSQSVPEIAVSILAQLIEKRAESILPCGNDAESRYE